MTPFAVPVLWVALTVSSAAIAVALALAYHLPEVIRSRWWKETPCRIINSQVKRDARGRVYLGVSFRFRFRDREYRGTRYEIREEFSDHWGPIAELVDDLKPGREMVCFVDPRNPEQAILNPRVRTGILVVIVPLIVVLLSAYQAWRLLRVEE